MKKPNLLLVDDDTNMLASLQDLLEDDYTVFMAHNGEAALELLRTSGMDFPVVVSDQSMPRLQGHELFRIIHREFPDTLGILFTGFPEVESLIQAVNEGHIYGCLRKDFQSQDLVQLVNRAYQWQESLRGLKAQAGLGVTDQLEQELQRAWRYGLEYVGVLIDWSGPAAPERLKQRLRKSDVVGNLNHSRSLVLLTHTPLDKAKPALDRLLTTCPECQLGILKPSSEQEPSVEAYLLTLSTEPLQTVTTALTGA